MHFDEKRPTRTSGTGKHGGLSDGISEASDVLSRLGLFRKRKTLAHRELGAGFVKSFPAGRKLRQNLLDNIDRLVLASCLKRWAARSRSSSAVTQKGFCMSRDPKPERQNKKMWQVNQPSVPGAIGHRQECPCHRRRLLRARVVNGGCGTQEMPHKKDISPAMQDLTPVCRLINAFGKVRRGIREKKMLEKYERSQYMYENKEISDKMPGKKSDIYV